MTYEEFCAARESGSSVIDLVKSGALPRTTAYKWEKKRAPAVPQSVPIDEFEQVSDDEGEPATVRVKTEPAPKATSRKRTGEKITEQTAGKLIEGMFLMASVLQNEPEWLLTADERSAVAGPLADTLDIIPNPIAKAVNEYAAPAVLATTLFGIITAKAKRIERKRMTPARTPQSAPIVTEAAPPRPDLRVVPPPIVDDVGRSAAAAAAAASAASKSELADDEPSEAEALFQ